MITATVCVAKPPNFVITIADDHGVHHSSVYGSPEFQTPNLQAMADEGIRFDNAYVASPACAPSRAALFTGRMPYSNGIVGNHEHELKPGVISLLPSLLEQGYEIVFHGKVGHAGRKHFGPYVPDGVKILGGGGLQQTMTLDQVESFLGSRPTDAPPLALFLGWTDTHTAWPPQEEARITSEDVVLPPKIFDTPETRVEMTRYVEGAEDIDRRVGQTRELIAKHLDPNNTLVVYTSDHGMPWPFAKWSLYETGIRTPLIAVWPGKIKSNSSTDAMVSWIDLVPTLIDLAGGTSPPGIDGRSFANVLLGETDEHRDVIYATHKGDHDKNVYPMRSVRLGDWKYIRNLHPEFAYTTHTDVWATEVPRLDEHWAHAGHHWQSYIEAAKTDPAATAFLHDYHSSPAEELYQIDKDPFEQNNLAALPQHADKLAELRAMVSKRMQEVDDDSALSGPPRLLIDFSLPPKPDQDAGATAQPAALVPIKTSLITETGMPRTIVKQGAQWNFGPGALQTYRGWQYAAFWDAKRQVTVARRQLPAGAWQCVSLGGYERTSTINRGKAGPKAQGFGDGHEKVAMGISTDGVIHLAFDHHVSTLHYRFSLPGVANQPSDHDWNESLFSPVQDHLGGPRIETVTYPNFVRDGDRMSLYLRLSGGSGSADSHFFEYESGRWIINDLSTSKLIDKRWSGGNGTVNAYPHTMFVHEGRRHLTWCWRDTPDARTCHDLCYAYSDDQGQTWRNSSGNFIAKLGSQFITADTLGIAVLDLPSGSSFVNGGSMTVDAAGDVHVLMMGPDHRPMMARRQSAKGSWTQLDAPSLGVLVAHKSNLWVVAESGLYQVGNDEVSAFKSVSRSIEHASEDSKFVVDLPRHRHDDTISVIGQTGTRVSVIDFPIGNLPPTTK